MIRSVSKWIAAVVIATTMTGWHVTSVSGQAPSRNTADRGSARRPPAPRPTPHPKRPDMLQQLMNSRSGLLSDVTWDLLSRIALQLFSGNEAELLSGNEAELLSGNAPELLSGNRAKLASENEAEILSGNRVNLFSNVKITIEFSNSGNHNGNHSVGDPATEGFQALDQNHDGKVSHDEFTRDKSSRKLRKARKRFRRLDQDGDLMLTAHEFNTRQKP